MSEQDPVPLPAALRDFVERETWAQAQTHPNWPREYIVRRSVDKELFLALGGHIHSYGYQADFFDTENTYFDAAGMSYWTNGASVEDVKAIVRCRTEDTYANRQENRTPPTARQECYHVYVIALDEEVLAKKKFRDRNPDYIAGKACVYVGYTSKTPEKRFEQHKTGDNCNSYARDYGKDLRRDLYEEHNPLRTLEEALAMEQELARKLQARGYGVWWN